MGANLREEYTRAAAKHGSALNEGRSVEANAAYRSLTRARRKLRALPDRGQSMLAELLEHDDAAVRRSAAMDVLPVDEHRALGVLEEVSKLPNFVGFDAQMIIKEWKAGRLKIK